MTYTKKILEFFLPIEQPWTRKTLDIGQTLHWVNVNVLTH